MLRQVRQRLRGLLGIMMGCVVMVGGCSPDNEEALASQTIKPKETGVVSSEFVTCPGPGDGDPARVLYFTLDRTGSYMTEPKTFEEMKQEVVRYVRQAPPNTMVYVAYVSEASKRADELVVKDLIPPSPESVNCKPTNPFDPAQRRHCATVKQQSEARRTCVQQAYQRITRQIEALSPVKATRTDFNGALWLAGEVLHAFPQADKAAIILSDGEDTVNKSPLRNPAGFGQVHVVLRPPLGKGLSVANGALTKYAELLRSSGAMVTVVPMNVPISAQVFGHGEPPTGTSGMAGVAMATR